MSGRSSVGVVREPLCRLLVGSPGCTSRLASGCGLPQQRRDPSRVPTPAAPSAGSPDGSPRFSSEDRRRQDPTERRAFTQLRADRAALAVHLLAEHGRITVSPTRSDARAVIVRDRRPCRRSGRGIRRRAEPHRRAPHGLSRARTRALVVHTGHADSPLLGRRPAIGLPSDGLIHEVTCVTTGIRGNLDLLTGSSRGSGTG